MPGGEHHALPRLVDGVIVSAVLNFFGAFVALLLLKPMRQGQMAEGAFPAALGMTRV